MPEILKGFTSFALFPVKPPAMNLKKPILLAFVLLAATHCFGQADKENGIRWMSFSEAVKQNEKSPRKIFVDVYTRWCSNCKKMDATTFKSPVQKG